MQLVAYQGHTGHTAAEQYNLSRRWCRRCVWFMAASHNSCVIYTLIDARREHWFFRVVLAGRKSWRCAAHTDHGRTHKKVTNFWYALAEIKWRFCQAKTRFLRICEIASWGFFALKSWKYKILNFKFNVFRLTFFFVLKIKRACFLNPHSFCRFFKINCSNSHIWMPWARPHNGDNLWKIPNFFVGWILSAIISGFSRARG